MDTKQEIARRYFREFDSARKIARDLHLNRKTVNKYLSDYCKSKATTDSGVDTKALQDYVSSPPIYDTQNRFKRKLTSEIEDMINAQLEDNQRKRQEGLRKQVKLKIDIHEHLLKHGFNIGYTSVCNYIRDKELRKQEAFIKQLYLPGEECEFDWAEVKLTIGGVKCRFYLAVFTSSYGNYRFCRLYHRQDTLAFMEAHNEFFAHIGGVYQEMVYDNMRVAIKEFVGRNEKTPTDALVNLSGWFHFRWRFCNARRGNEKGHVERSVEFVRRKAFCHIDSFDTEDQAQDHLLSTCNQMNALPGSTNKIPLESLQQERPSLWNYPGPMDCFLTHEVKVDKYATICLGTNRYSVPDELCSRMVEVKMYSNLLKMYYAHGLICSHERSYEKNKWVITLDHYLRTLNRKPGALHGSLALDQAPQTVKEVYTRWFIGQPRDFIELLLYCQQLQVPHKKLLDTAIYLSGICPDGVTGEKIIALLGNQTPLPNNPKEPQAKGEIETFSNLQLDEITRLMTLNMGEVA
jgi:hypothetical protein